MVIEQITPKAMAKHLELFCRLLSPREKPVYVPVAPEPHCLKLECRDNALNKVRTDGGFALYGWAIVERPNFYLEAQAHCVWGKQRNQLFDITPQDLPLSEVLFLKADLRLSTGEVERSRIYPIASDEIVGKYLALFESFKMLYREFHKRGHDFNLGLPEPIAQIKSKMDAIEKSIK